MSQEPEPAPDTDSTSALAPRRRPNGITFVLVLVWIAAIADLIAGIVLLLMSFDDARFANATVTAEVVRYYGLIALVVGLLTVMVALGLANGSQFARVFTVIVMTLRLLNAAWALIAIRYVTLWPAVFDLTLAVVIIALLNTRSASDFFRKRT